MLIDEPKVQRTDPKTARQNTAAILALRREGLTVQAVAARLGVPASTVGLRCRGAAAYRPLAAAERDFLAANAGLVFGVGLAAAKLVRRPDLGDDFAGEAWLGACRAVGDYEPGRGACLKTWVVAKAQFACLRHWDSLLREARRAGGPPVSLSQMPSPATGLEYDPADPQGESGREALERRDHAAAVLAFALPALSRRERWVLGRVADGASGTAVGRELGVSRQRALQMAARARGKCRRAVPSTCGEGE